MSRTNHPVYQVLVTKPGVAPISRAGVSPTTLLPGQIGIFDYETNLSIDTTDETTMRRVYFAVGLDKDGDGTTDDIIKSSGDYIETSRVHYLNVQCPQDCVPQIIQVQPTNILGDTEYVLKITADNETIRKIYGDNLPTKSFVVKTSCCETTNVCSCDDYTVCSKLSLDLVNKINLDTDGIFTAVLWDVANGVAVDVDDYDTWIEESANENACLAIRITGSCEAINSFTEINYNYSKVRGFNLTVNLLKLGDLSTSAGTITEIQALQQSEGLGYDIQQIEYEAGGWNGKPGPYRGLDLADRTYPGIEYNAVKASNYAMLTVGHDANVVSGFVDYTDDMETLICVPCENIDDIVGQGEWAAWIAWIALTKITVTVPADCCEESSSS